MTPLLTRLYPNGTADVNHFHAAGGTAFLIGELIGAGLLHEDARTVGGATLAEYRKVPEFLDGRAVWRDTVTESGDTDVLRPVAEPFDTHGGLRTMRGNLGRAVIKVSAVRPEHRVIEAASPRVRLAGTAPGGVRRRELDRDVVAVVRNQGPRANGMPELHRLTPPLGVLQDRGHRVALVTDGRMSGASGAVPAAIHVSPEAAAGGPLARVRDGDLVRLDADKGVLEVLVPDEEFAAREPAAGTSEQTYGTGRELFRPSRNAVGPAERGAGVFA